MAATKTEVTGYVSPFAIHPGETIKEELEFVGMSQADFATRVELSEKTVSLILNGLQPVTPETALKVERVLGLSDRLLLKMQAFYDADVFRLTEEERLKKEVKHLPKYTFYGDLANLGFVKATRDKNERVEELLRFFSVNSLTSVKTVLPVAYRQSSVLGRVSEEATAAWLQMGTKEAQKHEVKDFNRNVLLKNISRMRSLTRESANMYAQALIDLCAEAGVVLVYTPHLKQTCINGAVQWVSPNKVLVQLSLYNAYADIFWFTLFHELGHVLKHSKKETFVEFDKKMSRKVSELEREADLFAQKVLVPADKEPEYELLKRSLTKVNCVSRIRTFADSAGIDPGIIAGRIGKELNAWKYVSSLRRRLTFKR